MLFENKYVPHLLSIELEPFLICFILHVRVFAYMLLCLSYLYLEPAEVRRGCWVLELEL